MKINTKEGVEVDVKDVDYFYLIHERYQHGLLLKCKIKKRLVTFYGGSMFGQHTEADEYGMVRRKYNRNAYHIRNKDEPKLRNKIYNIINKHGKIVSRKVGSNAGTPIAQSWTITDKRISGEEVLKHLGVSQ